MKQLFVFLFVIFPERKTVECAGSASVRLVNGGSRCAGTVEVYYGGQWCTVYGYGSDGYGWDILAAAVVCKELGCGAALSAPVAQFGEGSDQVVMYNVRCRGSESALRDCPGNWGHYSRVSYSADAGVICSGSVSVRLVNGGSPCAGTVEVYYGGQRGTVYGYGSQDYGWDMKDAAVVCEELGCGAALSAPVAQFGKGSGSVVVYDVRCSGSESALRDCPGTWGHYSAVSYSADAGVICSGK
ncbi:soluble scavenger receptor cysteine-rich domain-containing protein SSC5D-like [Callorhinchus milii]|uniref:soluble scavenger receptor cysteine-rich domain-containing protein SSC5D-like n=1 Tax=Callorhinchus milii TaxID=7868 RepID=UPI001C3FF56D|nr:soluble scavenger receptor cysteine-rich domain-containing protein SSC5D-like [Callorhinchus milii]